MRHTIPIPRAHECDHGERLDRRTSEGLPACPLCRAEHLRSLEPPTLAWAMLAGGDDTHTPDQTDDLADLIRVLDGNREAIDRVKDLLRVMAEAEQATGRGRETRAVICARCAKPFTAVQWNATTCSNACRLAMHRRRRKATRKTIS